MSTSQRVSNNTGSIDAMLASIGTGDVTISTWFKFDNLSADGGIFYAGAFLFDNYYLACKYINSTGKIRLQARSGTTGPDDTIDNNTVIEVGKWYHIVAVRSGTTGKIYVNGALNSTTGANFGVSLGDGSAGVTTGFRDLAGANETGRNKELAIWDAALSDTDVYSLYNYGLPNNLGLADSYDTDRTANLKLWWRMGDNNGVPTTVADQTGNGYTGTIVGGAEFVVDHPDGHKNVQVSLQNTAANILARSQDRIGRTALATDTDVFYVFDGNTWRHFNFKQFTNALSASFDGSDNYLQLPNGVTSILEGTDWSLSMWYNLDVVGSFQEIFTAGSDLQIYFRPRASKVGLELYVNGGAGGLEEASPYSDINTWVHAVITRSSSSAINNANMYINGQHSAVGTVGQLSSLSNPVIGCFNGASLFMNGHIDEVALFTSALSGSDVTAMYNSGVPADLSSLSPAGWWRMGDGTGDTDSGGGAPANGDTIGTVVDQGSGKNDATGTGTNGPLYSRSVPVVLPSLTNALAGSFDGTGDYLEIPQGAFDLGTGNWTFSFWFRPTGITSTSETIFMVKGSSGKYLAGFVNNGAFMLSDWNNDTLSYSTTLADNTWYHGAYIKNGSGSTDLHLYLNGSKVLEGQHPQTPNYGNDTATTRIGEIQTIGSNSFPFQGQIDEFAFWSSALSASDVTAMYNSGVPADLSSLSPDGWWRMGDGTGDTDSGGGAPANGDTIGTVVDQGSGKNDATGTGTNGPTYSNSVPVVLPSLTNSLAGSFDGTNDYMDCGSVTQINSVTNLSTSSWFKIDAYQGGGGPIIVGGHSASPGNEFFVQAFDATKLRYGYNGSYGLYATGSIPTGSWHNVVTVQAGTNLTVYLNGTSILNATVTAVGSGWGSNFTIGRWSAGNYNYMNGHIDEVALFNSALSASDVTSIYNRGVPSDISSLNPVGWWRFGDGTGDTDSGGGAPANGDTIGTVVDQGSGKNDATGTGTNGPLYSNDAPVVLPSLTNSLAGSFDGTDHKLTLPNLSFLSGASAFSLSMWFKTSDSDAYLFGSYDSGLNNSIQAYFHSGSSLRFIVGTGSSYYQIGTSSTSLNNNTWKHAVFRFDGGSTVKIYINGSEETTVLISSGTSTVPSTTATNAGNNATIADYPAGSYSILGLMDELAFFDKALTETEISAMYNSGVPNDISSLNPVGWYRMGDGTGDTDSGGGAPANGDTIGTVVDQGSGKNDATGTGTNGPLYSSDTP